MNSAEQHSAAYHEASHAVIATLLGATLGNVSLSCEGGTWIGGTQVNWREGAGPARNKKIFQVAVAGPFGQAKYRARLKWSGAKFDKSDSLQQVITIIREGELQEHSRLSLGFVAADGSKHVFEVSDFNDIGDLEILSSLVQEFDDDTLLQLLGAVRDRLDAQAVWAATGDLADSLCQQQVSGHEAVAIVQKHGLV
jgi:hypothetical protein